MADTNRYQRELDNLIIQQERLKDKLSQAEQGLQWFQDATNNATQAEKDAAQKRLENAQKEQRVFESMLQERKNQIHEKANQAGVKVEERSIGDITKEENTKNGWGTFKQNLSSKGGMSGKAGIAAGIMNVVGGIVDTVSDIYIAEQKKELNTWMSQQDQYLKTIETTSKVFQRNLKTFSKGMQGALSSSFASITQGVQEGAYAAASSSVNFATESLANTFDTALDKFKLANYKVVRQQQAEFENLKLTSQEINGAAGLVGGVASMFGPIGQAVGGLVTGIAKATTKILEANAEIDIMRLQKEIEIEEKELEAINEAKTSALESAKEATSKVLDFSKAIETPSMKTDAAAKSMANIIGMSGSNADMYEKFVYGAARNLKFTDSTGKTTYLNKNAEDMLKMQSQYIDTSGRNQTMSQTDFVKTFQLGKVVGDDNLAAALLGDMDYFNKSIATGTDLIYEMFKEANKAGVSNRKFAKDLQQNLKLAQKYTFKGGVEAMMKMSIWAQKTRFNMQNLETMVDKIQDGGLEGVITQGAKLQVLGGNFAMGADPLAMMYESWADPESLTKRFADMTKGLGHFNSKTGEVDIVGPDAMMLKQYAEATGIDYKDARAMVTQRIKGERIDKTLTKNYNDQQKALIYNKAKLGKDGQWEVTLDNGQVKNINDLEGTDWNSLMPTEESIEDYVSKIYNLLEQQGGVTNFAQSVMADETFENLKQNINQRMTDNLKWITDSSDTLKGMIEKSNDFVTKQNDQQHDLMIATSKILDEQFSIIEKATEKLRLGIEDSGSDLRLALDAVKKELDYELAVIKYGENSKQAKDAAKVAGASNDNLANKLGITSSQDGAPTDTVLAMRAMAGNLTESELKERINNYKNLKKKHGQLTASNKSKFDDPVLSLGHGDKEILNSLQKRNVISHNYTSDLSEDEITDVIEALEYLVSHEQELVKHTKGYIGKETASATPKAQDPVLQNAWAAQANMAFKDGITAGNYAIYSQASSATPIHDGMATGGNRPMSVAASSVTPIHDGMATGGNRPMSVAASSVTPIHDGMATIAQSDPKDNAIFAKTGGPFDTLFNDIFGKINETFNLVSSESPKVEVLPMKDTETKETVAQQWDLASRMAELQPYSTPTTSSQPMELKISGSLDLKSGGQSVDIMGILRDNPLFIRELSQLLSTHLSQAKDGGKGMMSLQRH